MRTVDCLLCGSTGATVVELVRLVDPDAEPFAAVARCRDRQACRSRVESGGEAWPLDDATVAESSNVRHFTEGHRQVFAAAKRWREGRRGAA